MVNLEFVAGTTDAEGGRSATSKPQALVEEGKSATLTVATLANPRQKLLLKVTAKRLPAPTNQP